MIESDDRYGMGVIPYGRMVRLPEAMKKRPLKAASFYPEMFGNA